MTTRIVLETPLRRRAKIRYWVSVRDAARELGVSRQRVHQLAEELRMDTKRQGTGRTAPTWLRACCVDAAATRERCNFAHDEEAA